MGSAGWRTNSVSRVPQGQLRRGEKTQAGDRKEEDRAPPEDESKGPGPPQGQHSYSPDSHLSWQRGVVNGYTNQWRDGRMDTGINEGMNEWVQELTKGWMNGHRNQ